jgi:outer membrane protein assembly factor BamB
MRNLLRFAGITATLLLTTAARADDWPQWLGPQRDSVWRETRIIDRFPQGGPKVMWRAPIAGGYAGPAVAGGRVYVHDFLSDTPVPEGSPNARAEIKGKERLLCFDAVSGKQLWKYEYDVKYAISYPAGPRCTPAIVGGKVYALGAEGNLLCLDAVKGDLVWAKDLKKEYGLKQAPLWGFCSHPLIDGNKLFCIVGGKDAVVAAFDKDNGKELWHSLSAKEPGYGSPVLINAGGKKQLVVWHTESVNGLDPETGKPYWTVPLEATFGMSILAPRRSGDYLFVGGIGWKSVMLKLDPNKPAVEEVWRGKKGTAVHPVNCAAFLEDGYIYAVDQPGPLVCVKIETGERLWETTKPTTGDREANSGTAFLVKNGDRFFLFNEKGELIIAKLSPKGYEEIDRAKILEPTGRAFGRDVVWSHPAFANQCVLVRNDKELVCVSLGLPEK